MPRQRPEQAASWRHTLHEIIFEADTPAGKTFDLALIVSILFSVLVVMLDSIPRLRAAYGEVLFIAEWAFTLLFTLELILRLICVRRPWRYAVSFFGLVDILAVLPTYLSLFFYSTHYLLVIRVLRLLRIFRVLKLVPYVGEAQALLAALRASRRKILVFISAVLTLVIIFGSGMYVIEGEANGFTSIPISIYWAVVTLTTVGYGDISPKTDLGQALAACIMIFGYAIIAVPTGIVTVEMSRIPSKGITTQACPVCGAEGHDPDAVYCKKCGGKL